MTSQPAEYQSLQDGEYSADIELDPRGEGPRLRFSVDYEKYSTVTGKEGEVVPAYLVFSLSDSTPISHSIYAEVHRSAPYVFPRLIKEVRDFKEVMDPLTALEVQLFDDVLEGLTKIVMARKSLLL